jgi:hypothetical protein
MQKVLCNNSRVLCCAAGVFGVSDVQQLLHWLDSLARNPKGTDDVKAVTGVLPPVQKLVLQLLGQLNLVSRTCVHHEHGLLRCAMHLFYQLCTK